MGKYIAKRLGYMVVVALILSLLMFLVYTMIPYDRAVVEVDSYKASLKNNPNAGELYEKKLAEKRHELGTDQNVFIRYLGWVGVAPINGKYQGILQGDFGWSYKYSRPAYDVLKAPMKNTIFINIFATILGLGITIPLGIFRAGHRAAVRFFGAGQRIDDANKLAEEEAGDDDTDSDGERPAEGGCFLLHIQQHDDEREEHHNGPGVYKDLENAQEVGSQPDHDGGGGSKGKSHHHGGGDGVAHEDDHQGQDHGQGPENVKKYVAGKDVHNVREMECSGVICIGSTC